MFPIILSYLPPPAIELLNSGLTISNIVLCIVTHTLTSDCHTQSYISFDNFSTLSITFEADLLHVYQNNIQLFHLKPIESSAAMLAMKLSYILGGILIALLTPQSLFYPAYQS